MVDHSQAELAGMGLLKDNNVGTTLKYGNLRN